MRDNNSGETAQNDEQRPVIYKGAELVVFTCSVDDVNYAPKTDIGKELGIVGYSLWARFEDFELPIIDQSEQGTWMSISVDVYGPNPAEPVSEAFIDTVAALGETSGWAYVDPERFLEASDVERLLIDQIAGGLRNGKPPEAAGVAKWCMERQEQEVSEQ